MSERIVIESRRFSGTKVVVTYTVYPYSRGSVPYTSTFFFPEGFARYLGGTSREALLGSLAMFDAMKLSSLGTAEESVLDLGVFDGAVPAVMQRLFSQFWTNMFGPWRMAHGMPKRKPPRVEGSFSKASDFLPQDHVDGKVLHLDSGGKGSTAARLALAESSVIPMQLTGAFSYRGPLLKQVPSQPKQFRCGLVEDFVEAGVFDVLRRRSIICVETPILILMAIPLMLCRGFRYLAIGTGETARHPQAQWEGQNINSQWENSPLAVGLLNDYLQLFVPEGKLFSVLPGVRDPLIFSALVNSRRVPKFCGCGSCAACVYNWLGWAAWSNPRQAREDLRFDPFAEGVPRVLGELLGTRDHVPFARVGQPEETQLHYSMAVRKGLPSLFYNEGPPASANDLVKLESSDGFQLDPAILRYWQDRSDEALRHLRHL